jgi:hypothetical protein
VTARRDDPARLRRRLLVLSAPVALLLIVVIVKAVSMVVAGQIAASAYSERDRDALAGAVDALAVLNIAEPAKAPFAAGALAVLDNRIDEAERQFSTSLARTAPADSCPVRINLVLVRETLGDRASAALDGRAAIAHYRAARTVVEQAPPGCFAGNTDPDPQRNAVRAFALARLDAKIAAQVAPPPAPPPPPPGAAPPPPATASGAGPSDPERRLRLNPGAGPPLDRLQQILRDAAQSGR